MESNWVWNGWRGSGELAWAEIAARLLVPVGPSDWLWRTANPGQRFLILGRYDNSLGFIAEDVIGEVPPTGFPYGFIATQDRLA